MQSQPRTRGRRGKGRQRGLRLSQAGRRYCLGRECCGRAQYVARRAAAGWAGCGGELTGLNGNSVYRRKALPPHRRHKPLSRQKPRSGRDKTAAAMPLRGNLRRNGRIGAHRAFQAGFLSALVRWEGGRETRPESADPRVRQCERLGVQLDKASRSRAGGSFRISAMGHSNLRFSSSSV